MAQKTQIHSSNKKRNLIFRPKNKVFTNSFKQNLKKNFLNFKDGFESDCNFNYGIGSIVGFVFSQFVWIWVLKGFLKWFSLWFIEVVNTAAGVTTILTLETFNEFFWFVYISWFIINIIVRLNIKWSSKTNGNRN